VNRDMLRLARPVECSVSSADQVGDNHVMGDPPCCKLSPCPAEAE
jgi:hypothetical protein